MNPEVENYIKQRKKMIWLSRKFINQESYPTVRPSSPYTNNMEPNFAYRTTNVQYSSMGQMFRPPRW